MAAKFTQAPRHIFFLGKSAFGCCCGRFKNVWPLPPRLLRVRSHTQCPAWKTKVLCRGLRRRGTQVWLWESRRLQLERGRYLRLMKIGHKNIISWPFSTIKAFFVLVETDAVIWILLMPEMIFQFAPPRTSLTLFSPTEPPESKLQCLRMHHVSLFDEKRSTSTATQSTSIEGSETMKNEVEVRHCAIIKSGHLYALLWHTSPCVFRNSNRTSHAPQAWQASTFEPKKALATELQLKLAKALVKRCSRIRLDMDLFDHARIELHSCSQWKHGWKWKPYLLEFENDMPRFSTSYQGLISGPQKIHKSFFKQRKIG